jgi:hypothetical protein
MPNQNAFDLIQGAARASGWSTDQPQQPHASIQRMLVIYRGNGHALWVRYTLYGNVRNIRIYGPTGINWGVERATLFDRRSGAVLHEFTGVGKKRQINRYIRDHKVEKVKP